MNAEYGKKGGVFVLYYTANYVSSESNFVIQNVQKQGTTTYHPHMIAVLKNIIQRGHPTEPSHYVKEQFPMRTMKPFRLIPTDVNSSLVGKRLQEEIRNYPLIANLLVQNIPVSSIIPSSTNEARVDFYIECVKVVIQVDHHAPAELQKHGVRVFSFTTHELEQKTGAYHKKIEALRRHVQSFSQELALYQSMNEEIREDVRLMSVARFQLTILTLLEYGYEMTEIEVKDRENLQTFDIALHDLNVWMKALATLYNEPFQPIDPSVRIVKEFQSKTALKIDMSVESRERETVEDDVIYIRTAYLQTPDYFKMTVAAPFPYSLPQTEQIEDALLFFAQNLFQVDTFSPGQLEVITTLLQGRNTIAVAPTEMDQSLPYQLVAFLQPMPTLVIVPIPSFIYDEIHHLKEHKITRVPEMTRNQRKKESILQKYRENRSLFMFVGPEYVQTKSFRTFLQKTPIGFVVIHDVHSLSEWSDTFRTSYLHIGQTLRTYCKKAVLLGLTKEVAVSVLQDIKSELQTADIVTLNHRPELSFEVVEAGPDYAEKQQALTKIVREKGEAHGIVFTLNASGRKGCYTLAEQLAENLQKEVKFFSTSKPKNFHSKGPYHQYNRNVQLDFEENQCSLVVATKPFEMGMKKENVRYTIHYGLPESLSLLYQEAGRAGRDRKEAVSQLLYTKDALDERDTYALFAMDTTMQETKRIVNRYGYKSARDLLTNFLFWLKARPSVKAEAALMQTIFHTIAEPNTEKILHSQPLKRKIGDVQRALHRLSILGIVKEWSVKEWHPKDTIVYVTFQPYTDEHIEQSLLTYIKAYDATFSLSSHRMYKEQTKPFVLRMATILIDWFDEMLFYQKRMAFKTLIDSCSEHQLKEHVQHYFEMDDVTNQLADIVANEKAYPKWFAFCVEEEIEKKEVVLARFLETYRMNVGLNFISGIIRLRRKQFSHVDGRDRLKAAFQIIQHEQEETKQEILLQTLQIGKRLEEEQKQQVSEVLLTFYPHKAEVIYEHLQDYYTLHYILEHAITRIQKVGGVFL